MGVAQQGRIHPRARHHSRDVSLHPVPPWEHHPRTWGMMETLHVCPLHVQGGDGGVWAGMLRRRGQPQGGGRCPPRGSQCVHPACHSGHGSRLPGKVSALPTCPSWLWDTLTCTRVDVQGMALDPGNIQLGWAASQVRASWPQGKTAPLPTDLKRAWGQGELPQHRHRHLSQHVQPHCHPTCVPTSSPPVPPGALPLHSEN